LREFFEKFTGLRAASWGAIPRQEKEFSAAIIADARAGRHPAKALMTSTPRSPPSRNSASAAPRI